MKCPLCKSKISIENTINEQVKDEFIELASFFGRGWIFVNEYVDCFRTGQYASVTEKKRLRILQELRRLFEKCEFDYEKKKYRTDKKSIYGAIKVINDKELCKFKDHNYLKQILINPFEGTANVIKAQRVSAEGLTAKEENRREKDRQYRNVVKEPEEITGAEFLNQNKLGSLIDGIGKPIE